MHLAVTEELLNNRTIKELDNLTGQVTTLKVQANYDNGTALKYKVQGKLRDDFSYSTIALLRDSDLTIVSEVSDKGVYSADITGYTQITVTTSLITAPNDNTRIFASIYGDN